MTTVTDSLAADYAAKNADYYGLCRPEMLRFVPASAKRILEVGCGAGEFCAQFRRSAECELWGVEPNRDAALKAKEKLDNVFCSYFDESVELPSEYFDCIIFNDVLEHIYDGLSALKLTRKLLRNGGSVVASIPNIGHFPTIWRLVVRGQWEYTDKGILDKTHVRFFTRQSVQTLFEKAGFNIQRLDGINSFFSMEPEDGRLWHFYRMISWVPAKGIIDMRHLQFGVLAVK